MPFQNWRVFFLLTYVSPGLKNYQYISVYSKKLIEKIAQKIAIKILIRKNVVFMMKISSVTDNCKFYFNNILFSVCNYQQLYQHASVKSDEKTTHFESKIYLFSKGKAKGKSVLS